MRTIIYLVQSIHPLGLYFFCCLASCTFLFLLRSCLILLILHPSQTELSVFPIRFSFFIVVFAADNFVILYTPKKISQVELAQASHQVSSL